MLLLLAALTLILGGAALLGAFANAVGAKGRSQRAVDLAALSGARAMRTAYPRLFEPAVIDGERNPLHLERAAYLELGRAAAQATAAANDAPSVSVSFPNADAIAPVRVRVSTASPVSVGVGDSARSATVRAVAEAELVPPEMLGGDLVSNGAYDGPLAYRQGIPMRPDVALAFDRMAAAARADGVTLTIASGYRSDAEQARLFAAHPDPKWVAPPGHSLHRLGTELDLGPASAYGWLARNAGRFHFLQRYSWEPWHYGYTLNAGSRTPVAVSVERSGRGGDGGGSLPAFVPGRFAGDISRAAQRWNVSGTLLAAQLYAESGFNPFAVSPAGAQGIAQFMPATARAYGLRNPFDAGSAVDAQAHMMRDLLREFGSVSLALAAYNAGPGRVKACMCVPRIPETLAYVAKILGLMGGAGHAGALAASSGLEVKLVA